MKRFTVVFAIALLLVALGAIPVFAQSSGSFAYGSGNTDVGCVLMSNGSFSGGVQCIVTSVGTCPEIASGADVCTPGAGGNAACAGLVGAGSVCLPSVDCGGSGCCSTTACELFTCTSNNDCLKIYGSNSGATCNLADDLCQLPANNFPGNCVGNAQAGLKTNSGSGNVFDVRVSAVVGLLTDVTISSKQATPSSSALAGIDFTLAVTPGAGVPAPTMTPGGTVTFDARFIQISTNLFAGITANCTSAAGGCFITFAESTVSAHSFDWIIGQPGPKGAGSLQSGQYQIMASWAPSVGFGVSGIGEAAACVGPVILTAQQNKVFQFNTVNGL